MTRPPFEVADVIRKAGDKLDLPIENLDEVLKRKGLDAKSLAQVGPVNLPVTADLDNDESDGLSFDA